MLYFMLCYIMLYYVYIVMLCCCVVFCYVVLCCDEMLLCYFPLSCGRLWVRSMISHGPFGNYWGSSVINQWASSTAIPQNLCICTSSLLSTPVPQGKEILRVNLRFSNIAGKDHQKHCFRNAT